ncbi:uncharacterized protein LOC115626976 [Scaptodrosophila lebanonensis]|uniref:Uncharacterized protein LOC115626976 n=1 Tax=Drosophila lebanonensis TaxID=7225 RepID=A0A6J2TTX3_DROLE|nr:uncharacterized protein LOC115626976 [Scaptodrosophila lebanonensis]
MSGTPMEQKPASTFDWDNINVGDFNLNHSENFFSAAQKENQSDEAADAAQNTEAEEINGQYRPANLRVAPWSPLPMGETNAQVQSSVAIPKAYTFKDVYKGKHQEALRKRAEEERKAREFHSRPVPNFKAHHKRLDEAHLVHRVTIPRTPDVLKRWRGTAEQRRREKESEDPLSLEQPRKKSSEVKPFRLMSDQRVRERREFNAAVFSSMEEKQKKVIFY